MVLSYERQHYRADLDALRALAVIGVLLFHAGVPFLKGGFLGVDVFFVISGYLMTSIVVREAGAGVFSYAKFYERRARRILPALYFVIILCVPFAYYRLFPDELENFGQSMVATALMMNNILLYLTSGYWDLASEFKPLLHTWSLGVEEQFYLLLPLVCVFFSNHKLKFLLFFIGIIFFVSFIGGLVQFQNNPVGTFFLPQYRFWELATGSLCAELIRRGYFLTSSIWKLIGLVLIFASYVLLDQPGDVADWILNAVVVLGSCLVILCCNSGSIEEKFLGGRLILSIGKSSYSLYLIHQPVFAFIRSWSSTPPSMSSLVLAGFVCGVASLFMKKYVEDPFRSAQVGFAKFIFLVSFITISIIGVGCYFALSGGVKSRFFDSVQIDKNVDDISYNMSVRSRLPLNSSSAPSPEIIVAGNSFARDIVNIFIESNVVDPASLYYIEFRKTPCLAEIKMTASDLFAIRSADIFLFGSGEYNFSCFEADKVFLESMGVTSILYAGGKDFGYNINAFSRVPDDRRSKIKVAVTENVLRSNNSIIDVVGHAKFFDVLQLLGFDGTSVLLFSEDGLLNTADGKHLTKAGAVLSGRNLCKNHALCYRLFQIQPTGDSVVEN